MRPLIGVLTVATALTVGCTKKTSSTEALPTPAGPGLPTPAGTPSDSSRLLKQLAKTKREQQLHTADQLATLAETDPSIIPGLIELLKDKTNLGEGQVLAHAPNSVREAAVIALIYCGEPGETAAVEQGLPILLTGLTDSDAAVREHALVAIGRLKLKAKVAFPKVWPLAEDTSAFVRDAAYNCIRELGATSSSQIVKLMLHADAGVRLTAAEQLPGFKPLPADCVEPLRKALADSDKIVRSTAAEALQNFGAEAAPAAPDLAEAIRRTAMPAEPNTPFAIDYNVLNTLIAIGPASVEPVGKLLADKGPVVRYQALYVLGELGLLAKSTADAVEKILNSEAEDGFVRLEACRTLAAITGDAAKSAPLLKIALAHKEAGVRGLGLQAAARMGAPGRIFAEQVIPLLEAPEQPIRTLAIAYVVTLDAKGRTAAVPLLAKRLKDESASVRTSAVHALADFGPLAAGAAEDLAKAAAGDDDTEVRQTAIAALAELGPAGSGGKPTLLATLYDAKAGDELRGTALRVLANMAPADAELAEAVLKLLGDPSKSVREYAASVAARLKKPGPEIIAKLGAVATSDSSAGARTRAAQALAEIEPQPLAAKAQLETLTKWPIPELAHWAKIAIARIDRNDGEVARLIRTGLVGKVGERLASVDALGRLLPATAVDFPPVDRLSRSKEATVRQKAAEALGRFEREPAVAIPRLVEMLQDRDDDVKVAVIQSLAKFALKDSAATVKSLRLMGRDDIRVARAARRALAKLDPSAAQ